MRRSRRALNGSVLWYAYGSYGFAIIMVRIGHSRFGKAELGLGFGCRLLSVIFEANIMDVRLCHSKNGSPKLVPLELFFIKKDPWSLFYCKMWISSEKFGPPSRDEKHRPLDIFRLQKFVHWHI